MPDRSDHQRLVGLEAAQIRALAAALTPAPDDAAVALHLADTGALSVRIDRPEGRAWLAIDIDAHVLPALGPRSDR